MFIKDSLISQSDSQQWKEILQIRSELHHKYSAYWLNKNLFSLAWWLMVILFISLWFIWWKRVDKTKLNEIVTFGFMVALISNSCIDIIGCENVLWGYPIDLDPLISPLTVTDFCLIPITYMLLYQYFVNWKSFIIASVIISALYVFVAEPIAIQLNIFQLHNWKQHL